MRRFIRNLLPRPVVRALGATLLRRRTARLARLPIAEAFDEVYRRGMWQQGVSLSGLGSEGKWADDYVRFVVSYIREHGCRSVLDAGCGDFMVGQKLAQAVETYRAVDISKAIIDINRKKFSHLKNVIFDISNILEDQLPSCDLLLVRQVFQHLTNAQIESALVNIERASPKYALISEHTYRPGEMTKLNVDLNSHTITTRIAQKSGIDIGAPPFNRRRSVAAILEPGPENRAERDTVLCIYEMRLAS